MGKRITVFLNMVISWWFKNNQAFKIFMENLKKNFKSVNLSAYRLTEKTQTCKKLLKSFNYNNLKTTSKLR